MKKTLSLICATLFALCMYGMNGGHNIPKRFDDTRVKKEIVGKPFPEAKIAFDTLIGEIKQGKVSIDSVEYALSEKDSSECCKKAFNAYALIFIEYANSDSISDDDMQSIKGEAIRLIDMKLADKKTEKQLSDIVKKANDRLGNHPTTSTYRPTRPNGNQPAENPNKEIERLRTEITRLRNDSTHLAQTNTRLTEENTALKSQMSTRISDATEQSKREAQDWKTRYEAIRNAILANDAVLYKQCLLYPLEGRYNPTLIDDALNTISSFAKLGISSNEFNTYRTTYEPLLTQYKQFNNDLIAHLQDFIGQIEKKQRLMGNDSFTIEYESWKAKLQALPYYKLYEKRNNPPYKSIIYLDNQIDEYLDLIRKAPKDVNAAKKALQDIVKKLQPQQH